MPPADPSSATTATPIVAMPMSRRWPPLDILDRPLRGFCEASVDRHRFRCAGWKREANSDDGSTAQDSAHHRAAVELIHLARSPNIELPVRCRPAYRERSPRASGSPCVAPSRRRGVAWSPARQGRPFDRPWMTNSGFSSPLSGLSRATSGPNLTSCPIGSASGRSESDPKRRGSSAGMRKQRSYADRVANGSNSTLCCPTRSVR